MIINRIYEHQNHVAVASFLSGRAKDLSAPLYMYPQLHTPWSTVLEKRTGMQLAKKFPAFYGTRRFTTAFTNAGHLFLSSDSSI